MVLDFWAELKISKLIFFDKVIRQNVNIKSITHAALPQVLCLLSSKNTDYCGPPLSTVQKSKYKTQTSYTKENYNSTTKARYA